MFMMKEKSIKWIALLLTGVLMLSLCGMQALATPDEEESTANNFGGVDQQAVHDYDDKREDIHFLLPSDEFAKSYDFRQHNHHLPRDDHL